MSIELWSLFGAFAVALTSILVQGLYLDVRAGVPYVLSSRGAPPPNHGPMGGRLDRNVRNQVEGMMLFLPLVVVIELADLSSALTQSAALVYAASRALYVPTYAFDLTPLRTLVWAAGLMALFALAWGVASATAFA